MIGILHRYVLRELLKTFVLTATGLTLMFGMGGGLLNLIRIENISAADIARLLFWFFPLVASFMLPIAALLSCALVYGRLAADNELDACKASGINILQLLASAVGLALVVGVISFYLSNFTVPRLFQRIGEIAQGDIQNFVVAKFRDQGHSAMPFNKNFMIYADDARKLDAEESAKFLGEKDPRKQVVLIEKAAFVEFRDEDPLRTGTAEDILLIFDRSKTPMSVSARMLHVGVFDHQKPQFSTMDNQMIELPEIPSAPPGSRMKMKLFDLAELLRYQANPIEAPMMQAHLQQFRQGMTGLSLANQVVAAMTRDKVAVLRKAGGGEYRIRARKIHLDDKGRRPKIELIEPTIEQVEENKHVRYYRAGEGEIVFRTEAKTVTVGFLLRNNVTLQDPQETPMPVRLQSPCELPSVAVPIETVPGVMSYTDQEILDTTVPLPLPDPLQGYRQKIADLGRDLARRITAAIHSRLTMSASTVVLVLLAAALGILIRGGHALTAFGVAFLPTVIVVLVITTGRQLAENSATAVLGLTTMWGIIAVMATIDAVLVFGCIRK
jgi:lipopolysaccharide export LptBFGC system permease protein LptF